jgi:outer membrane scaffolding protein for murein synthesis (MipA/OmpV family)
MSTSAGRGRLAPARSRTARVTLAAALAALPALRAQADDVPAAPAPVARPQWELGAGVGVLDLPHYRGSDRYRTWVLPVPYVIYRGDFLKADRNGARAVLLRTQRLSFDLSLSAGAPARSEDDPARAGMSNLASTAEIGPNLNLNLAHGRHWKLDARVPVRGAFTVRAHPQLVGWTSTPNLDLDFVDVHGWNVGLQAAAVFADRRYDRYYYSVPAANATATRPAYDAPGGVGGASFLAATSRRFDRLWVGAFVRYDTLAGARFAPSPLVRERQQWSGGIAFAWVFARSAQMVPSWE